MTRTAAEALIGAAIAIAILAAYAGWEWMQYRDCTLIGHTPIYCIAQRII